MALRMYVSFAWRRRRWITNTIFYLSISSTSETRYPGIEVNKYKQTLWLKGRMTADVPAFFLKKHYVKSVRIRSYSGPHFPAFRLNTERCSVSLRVRPECRKIRTRITPNKDTFYAVEDICPENGLFRKNN